MQAIKRSLRSYSYMARMHPRMLLALCLDGAVVFALLLFTRGLVTREGMTMLSLAAIALCIIATVTLAYSVYVGSHVFSDADDEE